MTSTRSESYLEPVKLCEDMPEQLAAECAELALERPIRGVGWHELRDLGT
jgi:hypothetical protein